MWVTSFLVFTGPEMEKDFVSKWIIPRVSLIPDLDKVDNEIGEFRADGVVVICYGSHKKLIQEGVLCLKSQHSPMFSIFPYFISSICVYIRYAFTLFLK